MPENLSFLRKEYGDSEVDAALDYLKEHDPRDEADKNYP